MAKRPCLRCGSPSSNTYCDPCYKAKQQKRNQRRLHYRGDYDKRRKALRTQYPTGPCWLCHQIINPDDWTADHVTPGDPASELRPAHAVCNYRRGGGSRS